MIIVCPLTYGNPDRQGITLLYTHPKVQCGLGRRVIGNGARSRESLVLAQRMDREYSSDIVQKC